MSDLISRADALKEIEANIKANEKCAFESEEWVAGQHDAMDIIKRLASATQSNDSNALKALEREKGKWLLFDGYRCSICKHKLQTTGLPQYCPHCGSEMEI